MVFAAVRAGVRVAFGLVALASGVAAPAAADPRPVYAIVRVGSALSDEDRVGAKRVGIFCMPNGALHWGDVATGGAMDQREIVQDALEDAGLPVTPLGSLDGASRRPVLRLRATVRAAGFRMCAKNYLGDAKAFSGDAALDVEWRVEGAEGSEVPHLSHVARHVEPGQAASLGAIYRKLLGDAARDAARWLLTPQT